MFAREMRGKTMSDVTAVGAAAVDASYVSAGVIQTTVIQKAIHDTYFAPCIFVYQAIYHQFLAAELTNNPAGSGDTALTRANAKAAGFQDIHADADSDDKMLPYWFDNQMRRSQLQLLVNTWAALKVALTSDYSAADVPSMTALTTAMAAVDPAITKANVITANDESAQQYSYTGANDEEKFTSILTLYKADSSNQVTKAAELAKRIAENWWSANTWTGAAKGTGYRLQHFLKTGTVAGTSFVPGRWDVATLLDDYMVGPGTGSTQMKTHTSNAVIAMNTHIRECHYASLGVAKFNAVTT